MKYLFVAAAAVLLAGCTAAEPAEVEVAFSPKDGALELVSKVLGTARHSIDMAAYTFTSPEVATGLIQARTRGVQVRVVVDAHEASTESAQPVLAALAGAGVQIKTVDMGRSRMHDKFLVVDERTVQTGSFNYTRSASYYNAENVVVIWKTPSIATQYARQFSKAWSSQ